MSTDTTQSSALDTFGTETRTFPPPAEFVRQANVTDPAVYERADKDFEGFWAEHARTLLWRKPFTKVLEWEAPYAKWFADGQLNVSENCLDRHVNAGKGAKVAYQWEGESGDTRTLTYHDLVAKQKPDCPAEAVDAEHMLYLLYTSGTTAKPKGIVHTTGGYLTGVAATTKVIFDVKDNDVFWCAADVGWVTGHSYIVFGPLANGVTGVMYEGTPDFPDKDRWWSIIEKYKVSILYCAPTAIRTFMKWGPEYIQKHDMRSLRLLGSVGEPINPQAWLLYRH